MIVEPMKTTLSPEISYENAIRFQALIENSTDIVSIHDADGILRYATPTFEKTLGYRLGDCIGKNMFEFIHPADLAEASHAFRRVIERSNPRIPTEFRIRHANGSWIPVEAIGNNLLADPIVQGIVIDTRDISDRKDAESKYRTLVDQLPAITYIMTLGRPHQTIYISPQVESLLGFTPAEWIADPELWIHQLHPTDHDRVLQYMRQQNARHAPIDVEYRLLSRDGRIVWFHNQSVSVRDDNGHVRYSHGILFDITQLKQSEQALVQAYDTTLEGWSRALDMRDKETQGHTDRVVELTLRLARDMGLDEPELVHVRRGALLHDIGKLGVPDRILHKPGPLTDDEWETMRKHPTFAYELLLPIAYLHPALDIPYCHHEKWDGTGYPRGLQGKEIPLVARIFTIVDVWDGLRHDRPYREARSVQETKEYIESEAGKYFDPEIVQVFLRMMNQAESF